MICPHTPTGSCLVNDKYPPSVRDQSTRDLKHGLFGVEPKLIAGHYPSINDDKKRTCFFNLVCKQIKMKKNEWYWLRAVLGVSREKRNVHSGQESGFPLIYELQKTGINHDTVYLRPQARSVRPCEHVWAVQPWPEESVRMRHLE